MKNMILTVLAVSLVIDTVAHVTSEGKTKWPTLVSQVAYTILILGIMYLSDGGI